MEQAAGWGLVGWLVGWLGWCFLLRLWCSRALLLGATLGQISRSGVGLAKTLCGSCCGISVSWYFSGSVRGGRGGGWLRSWLIFPVSFLFCFVFCVRSHLLLLSIFPPFFGFAVSWVAVGGHGSLPLLYPYSCFSLFFLSGFLGTASRIWGFSRRGRGGIRSHLLAWVPWVSRVWRLHFCFILRQIPLSLFGGWSGSVGKAFRETRERACNGSVVAAVCLFCVCVCVCCEFWVGLSK